ncbi:MAG: hypothetical protein CMH52_13865 [Myxococcales bacterium]|nr:hypothetical protein [Myxococcales bacterium]|tara:strand:- start:546 stop:1835 length:1290 start_codon:yes stop_codon:yes gene_type:complete
MTDGTHPSELSAPTDRMSLSAQIKARTGEVRGVGSRTSKSPCYETDGLEIRVDGFTGIERLENHQVRVGAGCTLNELLNVLGRHGLALPTIGEWDGQTVGGAIATGTHGGSYKYGSLISSVVDAVLVDGNGRRRTFKRGWKNFQHVLPCFGTLGVFTEFVLQCEPSFELHLKRRVFGIDTFLERLLQPDQSTEFRSAIWMPAADFVLDYSASRPDSPLHGVRRKREVRFNDTAMVLDWLTKQTAWVKSQVSRTDELDSVGRAYTQRLFPARDYCGPYDAMLAPLKGDAATILAKRAKNKTPPEGEFAVSYAAAKPFLDALMTDMKSLNAFPDRPIGLRPGAAEFGTLSAAQGEPCIWVSMFLYPNNPLMERLPNRLIEFSARPHWGKCVFHRRDEIASLYPGWTDFSAFRNTLDRDRKFVNHFALSLGL